MKISVLFLLMVSGIVARAGNPLPADKNATKETIKLYQNLFQLREKGIMFGHQDALAYGHNWYKEKNRSDVKDVCGDYPAVYGWEIGHLELGDNYSLDSVYFSDIRNYIKTVYKRGGINTISWHLRNPFTGGSSWDTSSKEAVKSILPGGEKHELYKSWLTVLANFLTELKTENGTYIPVLFRPFHEHTGSWFWWGKNLCTIDEYKSLWKFTVDYLQNEKNIHHLLYTYSTDRFTTTDEYLERYPGDERIDILGFDLYDRGPDYPATLTNCAEKVTTLAQNKGKIATVSETGGNLGKNINWWTETLFTNLKPFPVSYVLVWRNPFKATSHGAFGPYKNSPDSENFIEFYNNSKTLFQNDVSKFNIYQ